ncbi:DUF4937 domain-containing protein [Kitasatospora sp. NPDC048722]|uniref:DUF4937 domain-containing protein n=1 Tax=Kitasatospora sp. NPDC048722 TaxID=3155639 RepID=UPI0034037612
MWIKWINCRVLPGGRADFAKAQCRWTAIADQPGPVGQVGGWEPGGEGAHVLGVWADEEACTAFMEVARGTALRVADCHLHPGRAEHFLAALRSTCGPAPAAAGGMLAGTVARPPNATSS